MNILPAGNGFAIQWAKRSVAKQYKSRFESRDECNCHFLPDYVIQAGLLKALQLTCATQQQLHTYTIAGYQKKILIF